MPSGDEASVLPRLDRGRRSVEEGGSLPGAAELVDDGGCLGHVRNIRRERPEVNDLFGRTERADLSHCGLMTNREHVGRQLAALRERAGLSVREVAKALDLSDTQVSTYSSYERPAFKGPYIPMKWAQKLVPVLRGRGEPPVTAEEVLALAGVGSLAPAVSQENAREAPGGPAMPGYIVLREYDVVAAAGDGAVPALNGNGDARILAEWTVPKALLPARYQGGQIAIIHVQGDSMAPEIMPEERVMVDTSQTYVGPEGIYLIWESESLLVKRVQKVPGRRLRIISRNPEYQPYEQPVDEVRVLGRVIGRWEWK